MMLRILAGALAAALLITSVLTGLVVLGAATSLQPRPHDLAPVDATAVRRVSVVLPPYHSRADPAARAAVAPIGGETACADWGPRPRTMVATTETLTTGTR